MGVGLCKGRGYENGGGRQELLGSVTPSPFQAGLHLKKGWEVDKTHPTSRSSMVPGWKGGKALPFGGSFGEYSLNDFEEQPRRQRKKGSP